MREIYIRLCEISCGRDLVRVSDIDLNWNILSRFRLGP